MHAWSVGEHLTHRFNSELGTGRVMAIEGRVLVVHFPQNGTTLRLAATSDALVSETERSRQRNRSLFDRLSAGDIDDNEDFLTRLDILHLLATREASGLGSFLGGRVRLFPHQLHVAERATAQMPVRWLLADEVGLGKTIEAALIMNRLLHTQGIERCLVVAPEALTVQWLGELWRKYHQVFTVLDAPRLADVARDFGAGFNPFDVHRRGVAAIETLIRRPELVGQAVAAGIDLLVVDEAQRLRRPPGHPGEPAYRAIAPLAALGRHVLLLSATPLEDDVHGFFRLLQLLRPDEFPEGLDIEARLDSGVPLPPCTSSTRRVDIGGLPPRVPVAVDLPATNEVAPREPLADTPLDLLVACRFSPKFNSGHSLPPEGGSHRADPGALSPETGSHTADPVALPPDEGSHTADPVALPPDAGSHTADPVALPPDAGSHTADPVALRPEAASHTADPAALSPDAGSHTPDPGALRPDAGGHTADPAARPPAAGSHRADPVARRRALDRIRRGLASGAALEAVLGPDETDLRQRAKAMDRHDPRLAWLLTQAARWRRAKEKSLVFVAHRETLEMLRDALSARAQLASGVFHEELSAARRDMEVARFRAEDGPSILVSTEAGGEGRNFEFCHRLVLYDLPWKPATVEQRIGRLDRIGRRIPVEIVYFRPASGMGADVVRLLERLGLFREPIAGLEPELAHVESALEEIALDPAASLSDTQIERLTAGAHAARSRIHEAAYQQLHRDPYRAELGPSILARVPAGLDALMERVVVKAAAQLGFRTEPVRGRRAYAIEFGNEALIDSLAGVQGGSSFVGSFDREYAVEDDTIDFFASGHVLVEGLLAHFEEDPKGRVGRLQISIPGGGGPGLVAIYKDGPQFEVLAFDAEGHARPDWADGFRSRSPGALMMKNEDAAGYDWAALVARLAPQLGSRRPHAIAAVMVESEESKP